MAIRYNSPPTVNDGLILCIDPINPKCYSGIGTICTDISGKGNDATLLNGTTFDSTNGGAFVFDGVTNAIVASNFNSIKNTKYVLHADSTRTWSISSWFLPTLPGINTTSLAVITEQSAIVTTTNTIYGVWIPPNTTTLSTRLRTGTVVNITTSLQSIWNEVVVTWDGTIGKAYLNGSYVSDIVVGNTGAVTNNPLYIGANDLSNVKSNYYTGKISNVKVYNRALSADEVSQNYNALRVRYGV